MNPPTPPGRGPTLESMLPEYLAYLAAQGRANHTVRAAELDLRQLARFLGRQPVAAVATADLRAFQRWLAVQRGNGPASLRRKTSTLKGLFAWLSAGGQIKPDPAEALVYPPLIPRNPAPLTPPETAALVAAAEIPSWRVAVLLLLECGLKRDEVVALDWDDIEPDQRRAGLRILVRRRRAARRVRRRVLPATPRLADALAVLQATAGRHGSVANLSPRGVDFVVATSAQRAGVRPHQNVTPQMLRDAYACRRVEAFLRIESRHPPDSDQRRALAATHDLLLLRELGLSDRSGAAARYRRLVQQAHANRPE